MRKPIKSGVPDALSSPILDRCSIYVFSDRSFLDCFGLAGLPLAGLSPTLYQRTKVGRGNDRCNDSGPPRLRYYELMPHMARARVRLLAGLPALEGAALCTA